MLTHVCTMIGICSSAVVICFVTYETSNGGAYFTGTVYAMYSLPYLLFFFFQAEDGIRDVAVTGVQTCALPILALLLTSIGLYGLESQRVAQRTAEIGLRMALGAQGKDMLWFILREAGVVFAIGVPIGLALTFAASHFIGALLYEISPLDPRIHFVTVLILLGAGFLASFIPARRAMSVDPMVALRYE